MFMRNNCWKNKPNKKLMLARIEGKGAEMGNPERGGKQPSAVS
jgi:hypothetical protein